MSRFSCWVIVALTLIAADAFAQAPSYKYTGASPPGTQATPAASTYNPPTASSPNAPASQPSATFKPEEIEQIVAPIALYPDSLLSQILMASTYPVELVQAERWGKANTSLKGEALTKALEAQPWDASVKSLINFPDVLNMMSQKLDWTVKLGDAFIAQQKDIMDSVQKLRTKAQAQGNLKTNEQQTVTVAPATQPAAVTTQIITIESSNPQVIYVPTYNPTVVYGTWAYPSYPPYYYYPPAYNPGAAAVSFGVGLAVGAAWGYAWGGCNWGGSDVDIDIDRNTNINNNIDRSRYKNEFNNNRAKTADRAANGVGDRAGPGNSGRGNFQHNAAHRGGVAYRDQSTAQRFGGQSSASAAQARDAYRGRTDTGRSNFASGGASNYRANTGAGGVGGTGAARPSNTGARTGSASGGYGVSGGSRPAQTGTRSSGFNGAGGSGNAARTYSQRGQTSRSSGGATRSAPARSSAPRGGGGGGRGGGGRR